MERPALALATPGFAFEHQEIAWHVPPFELPAGGLAALELPGAAEADRAGYCLLGQRLMVRGTVFLFGADVTLAPRELLLALARRVAFAPDQPAFLSTVPVPDNVAIPLRDRQNLPEAELFLRVDRRLRSLSVEIVGRVLPGQLTPRRRYLAGLARALLAEPELLLASAPDPALPPELARAVREELAAANRRGAAVLLLGGSGLKELLDVDNIYVATPQGRADAASSPLRKGLTG